MKHELNMKYLLSARELYFEVCNDIENGYDAIESYERYFDALDLLYQEPKLGHFVATNKKGEVMERPKMETYGYVENSSFDSDSSGWSFEGGEKAYGEAMDQYQSALDRRLWSGWEIANDLLFNRSTDTYFDLTDFKSYNDLITSGVKLERIERK